MSEKIVLEAARREIIGKQVRHMRREGIIPAVIYGPEVDPVAISVDHREVRTVLAQAGGTQLIDLKLGGETIPTLARAVQRDPIRGDILHVDFYRVSMTRKIAADVPVVLVGESAAVEAGMAILIHPLVSLEIQALPADLPAHIEVDITSLAKPGDQRLVRDLVLPPGCVALGEGDELVVMLDYVPSAEEVEEAPLFVESAEVEVITERRPRDEEEE
jgi:large subunit ribosomal protein L25